MEDYLEAGGLIIARLRQRLPDIRVAPTWSMTEIKETPDLAPSLLVLLEGDTPGDFIVGGKTHKVEQRWTVVVTVTWKDMGTMALTASEFLVKSAGIYIPETSTKIADTGTPIKVAYPAKMMENRGRIDPCPFYKKC